MDIRPLTADRIPDFDRLMASTVSSDHCRCMWFHKPVKAFHADGREGNGKDFGKLVANSKAPAGLLAYDGSDPVGWCACGPRTRFARAILTPTYQGRDATEDLEVWLIPCLFVHPRYRGQEVTRDLVVAAVTLAESLGAKAIEAFPYSGTERQSRDTQVGFQTIFETAGFKVVGSPSSKRSIMRREF